MSVKVLQDEWSEYLEKNEPLARVSEELESVLSKIYKLRTKLKEEYEEITNISWNGIAFDGCIQEVWDSYTRKTRSSSRFVRVKRKRQTFSPLENATLPSNNKDSKRDREALKEISLGIKEEDWIRGCALMSPSPPLSPQENNARLPIPKDLKRDEGELKEISLGIKEEDWIRGCALLSPSPKHSPKKPSVAVPSDPVDATGRRRSKKRKEEATDRKERDKHIKKTNEGVLVSSSFRDKVKCLYDCINRMYQFTGRGSKNEDRDEEIDVVNEAFTPFIRKWNRQPICIFSDYRFEDEFRAILRASDDHRRSFHIWTHVLGRKHAFVDEISIRDCEEGKKGRVVVCISCRRNSKKKKRKHSQERQSLGF